MGMSTTSTNMGMSTTSTGSTTTIITKKAV